MRKSRPLISYFLSLSMVTNVFFLSQTGFAASLPRFSGNAQEILGVRPGDIGVVLAEKPTKIWGSKRLYPHTLLRLVEGTQGKYVRKKFESRYVLEYCGVGTKDFDSQSLYSVEQCETVIELNEEQLGLLQDSLLPQIGKINTRLSASAKAKAAAGLAGGVMGISSGVVLTYIGFTGALFAGPIGAVVLGFAALFAGLWSLDYGISNASSPDAVVKLIGQGLSEAFEEGGTVTLEYDANINRKRLISRLNELIQSLAAEAQVQVPMML